MVLILDAQSILVALRAPHSGRGPSSHPLKDERLSALYRDHRTIPSPDWEIHHRSGSYLSFLFPLMPIGSKNIKSIKYSVELPAGLIDDGETPEQAGIRELREETGYEAEGVIDSSAVLANDPGLYLHSFCAAWLTTRTP
jgi:hypothetical protein